MAEVRVAALAAVADGVIVVAVDLVAAALAPAPAPAPVPVPVPVPAVAVAVAAHMFVAANPAVADPAVAYNPSKNWAWIQLKIQGENEHCWKSLGFG